MREKEDKPVVKMVRERKKRELGKKELRLIVSKALEKSTAMSRT